MSRETSEWLNRMILVGFTDKRGNAWHYRDEDQGDESNHYPGAIPVDDVLRRLFNFEVREQELYILTDHGYTEVPGRKAMVTSDDEFVLGVFKAGYRGHQYQEWLLDNVATILGNGGNLGIGAAGLLKLRGQAFVTVEVPDSITTPEGVIFRPNLLACTSFDGSLATTYKRVVTDVVCDNTKDAALGEEGQELKIKHSKYSDVRIKDARDALQIVYTMADDFAAEVAKLTAQSVSDFEWNKLLDVMVPLEDNKGNKVEGRGKTMADNKRTDLIKLYNSDPRVAPWNGTAYGVLQAYNTWNHHFAIVRGDTTRYIRNMENVVTGKMANKDNEVLTALQAVIA